MPSALALAIETRLQLFDRGARQHQRVMLQDVIDIGADGGEHVDTHDVAGGAGETFVHRLAVDNQHLLAPAALRERTGENLGLGIGQFQAIDDDQSGQSLRGQGHLEAKRADLLVQRDVELAATRAVSLTAADEDRSLAIAVTSRTAALLATELLARAGHVRTLARGAGNAAAVLELPGDDAVQDVGTRLKTEYRVRKLDFAVAGRAIKVEDLYLSHLALLAFGALGRPTRFGGRIGGRRFIAVGRSDEAGGIRRLDVTRNLHGIAHRQPGVLGTGDRTLDEDQAALIIDADDFEVLLRPFAVTHVAGHLLVLEDAARIL